jgi:hypothetical protein
MKRWNQERTRTLREFNKYRRTHIGWRIDCYTEIDKSPYDMCLRYESQPGRFRKMKHLDCGCSHCFVCHSDKFPKRKKTSKEINFEIRFKESIEEMNDE